MRKFLLSVPCVAFLASCASAPPENYRERISNVPHTLILQVPPAFYVHSLVSKLVLGGISGMAMAGWQGSSLTHTFGIVDPAIALGAALSSDLARELKSPNIGTQRETDADKVLQTKDLTFATDSKGLALHIRTSEWSLMAPTFAPSTYFLKYSSNANLVDSRSMSSIAHTPCTWTNKESLAKLPTMDEYTADQAALLKASLAEAISHCQKHFASFMFPNITRINTAPKTSPMAAIAPPTQIAPVGPVDPTLSPKAQNAWPDYLKRQLPKAFAIPEKGGGYGASWGLGKGTATRAIDPNERAIQVCEESTKQRCVLYAINDKIL